MKKILSLLTMLALTIGAWAETVTMQYTGSTTTNMTANNNAEIVGLSSTDWSVTATKCGNNYPGLNKDGTIRLYWNANGASAITVESLTGKTINTINVTYKANYNNGKVLVDDEVVTGNNGLYEINSTSFVITNGNTSNVQVHIVSIVIDYGDATTVTVTPPTFSPAAGEVEADTEVTISAPDAEMIVYTTDGTDPSYEEDNGDIYTEPIVVNQAMTIKAIAVDADENVSAIASATYTIAPQAVTCATIAEFNALADGTEFTFTGELTVSGQTGQYLYAQDNNKGILIYGNLNDNIKYNKLDVIPAGWKGKKTTYNGAPEATNLSNFAAATTQANLTAEEITIPNVTLENVFRYVIINEVTYTPGSGKNGSINDGEDDLATYNRFNIEVPNDNNTYNVIGITGYYNGAQFMPLEFVGYVEPSNEISTVAEFLALENNKEFKFTGNLVCVQDYSVSGTNSSGQQYTNRYLYAADETGGIVIYNPDANTPLYETTDVIPGGWTATKTFYKGLPEAIAATDFAEKTGNQNITPIEMTIAEAKSSELLGAWIVVKNVLIREKTVQSNNGERTVYYITSDETDELELFFGHTTPFDLPEELNMAKDTNTDRYDMYGILGVYNTTRQIMPTGIGQNGEIITSIETIDNGVKKVAYYNMQGIESSEPFDGLNIVVTEYENGTKKINKQIYKF